MPWEKQFDIDDAIDRATKVFWAKGYEATSMADLVNEMGINKGSLYNAFGSKKELFTRALLKFDRDNGKQLLAQAEALDDPVKAIAKLFDLMIGECAADTEKKGCLIINTALELPNHSDDVVELVQAALDDFEAFFRRMIKLGQKRGDISKSVKAAQTAKSLMALVVGMRVLSRGAFSHSDLRAVKNDALKLIAK